MAVTLKAKLPQFTKGKMRVHFQQTPWDLFVCVVYTALIGSSIFALGIGNFAGLLLLFFTPGYGFAAAIFPKDKQVDWLERIIVSVGVSIVVVPLLGLLLNFTPWGIRFAPSVVTITLFTIGVGYTAYWRRMRLPPDQRLSLTVDLAVPN